jgi:hypothetical protein
MSVLYGAETVRNGWGDDWLFSDSRSSWCTCTQLPHRLLRTNRHLSTLGTMLAIMLIVNARSCKEDLVQYLCSYNFLRKRLYVWLPLNEMLDTSQCTNLYGVLCSEYSIEYQESGGTHRYTVAPHNN